MIFLRKILQVIISAISSSYVKTSLIVPVSAAATAAAVAVPVYCAMTDTSSDDLTQLSSSLISAGAALGAYAGCNLTTWAWKKMEPTVNSIKSIAADVLWSSSNKKFRNELFLLRIEYGEPPQQIAEKLSKIIPNNMKQEGVVNCIFEECNSAVPPILNIGTFMRP